MVPPQSLGGDGGLEGTSSGGLRLPGFSDEENQHLVREVAEMAATAATVAARDAVRAPRKTSLNAQIPHHSKPSSIYRGVTQDHAEGHESGSQGGGHDAPNWSRTKSSVVLLGATLLYAVIAEILVNTVDVVLESIDIDEKFLGITLFALVPNTTEFLVSSFEPGSKVPCR
jgi:Ca2+:H+ antiporter